MPNQTLISLLNDIIRRHNLTVDPVSNLLGSPAIGLANPLDGLSTGLQWRIFNLPTISTSIVPLSPDEIITQLSSLQTVSSPVITSTDGVVTYTAPQGISMISTVINLPHAISIPIQIEAASRQISVYTHETLTVRNSSNLQDRIFLPAGKTPLNIVTVGGSPTAITITLPPDITGDSMSFSPPAPSWLSSGTIDPNYYDPATQTTGIKLFWNNQPTVGGWDVYRVNTTDFGTIQACASMAGNYSIQTTFSGAANLPSLGSMGMVQGLYIGNLNSCQYNSSDNISTFNFRALDLGDSILSGTLQMLTFSNIATIPRNSDATTISFVDLNVAKGSSYSYTIDSFSIVDNFIRSDKAQILTVTAADVDGIAAISLDEANPGYLTLSLEGIGQQVRYWSGYLRKGNWPTILSGSATAQISNDYLRFDAVDVAQTTFTFSAGMGTWYAIVIPYDAHNNPGFYVVTSGQVNGTQNTTPLITQCGVDFVHNGGGQPLNRLWWRTNQAGERPGLGNGAIAVAIVSYNNAFAPDDFDGYHFLSDLSNPRYLWQDSEDNDSYLNTDDTINTLPRYGSIIDIYTPDESGYSTISYTISVYSGTAFIGQYNTSIIGPYKFVPGGGL